MPNAKVIITTALALSLAASILPAMPPTVDPTAVERVAHAAPVNTVEAVVAPAGQPIKIERASFTADLRPHSLPVLELDGLSMLETPPPIILAGQSGAEASAEEVEEVAGELAGGDVVEHDGEDEEFAVEPLASRSSKLSSALVKTGKKYLGVPYFWGGTDPRRGLDCSGFVQLVARQQGISLPRLARQQARVGTKVKLSQAKPGDLVGMRNGSHIAIYLGGGKIIHAPQPGSTVSIRKLTRQDDVDVIRRPR